MNPGPDNEPDTQAATAAVRAGRESPFDDAWAMRSIVMRPAAGLSLAAVLLSAEADARGQERPVSLEAAYTGEVWHNARGGIDRGSAYLDNVGVAVGADLEALWNVPGTEVVLEGLYNNGNGLSSSLTGDLQTVSNIESGPNELRVYQALVSTRFGDGGSVRAGLYDLNSEFDVLESADLFINSAHGIGTDIGQSGRNGPSIFPLTSLGLRVAWAWDGGWQARAAVLDGVPGERSDASEMSVDLGHGDGALLAAEIERETGTATLLLGAWGYTAEFESWRSDGDTGRRDDGNRGWYLRGEWRPADDVALFARWGRAEPRFNPFETFVGAGIRWSGPLQHRPRDDLGFAVAWAEASRTYRAHEDEAGRAVRRREVALELTYRMPLGERLVLQPDLQYVVHPGLDASLGDALAVGLRVELTLN